MNLIRHSLFSAVLTLPLFPAPSLTVNGIEANYTTSKFYLDELAGESSTMNIVLNPDESTPITAAEVFTNLNNRERANDDVDGDGISNISSPANRASAMTSFQNFTTAADAKGISLMLDAPFNHTAYDVEFADLGVELFQCDGDPLSPTTEIRNYDARFFSRADDYCQRAFNSSSIAIAPDRGDFGKFVDTYDVYFGRYASLVCTNPADNDARLNEGDWFAFDDPNWTSNDITVDGIQRNITKQVWRYFAGYALHWLDKTGYPKGTIPTEANRHTGIDGLRCDFGQGLPPRA